MVQHILMGAMLGGLFAGCDGALFGCLVRMFATEDPLWRVVGFWTLAFAVPGAAVGGLIGAFWGPLKKRLTLPPPDDADGLKNPPT